LGLGGGLGLGLGLGLELGLGLRLGFGLGFGLCVEPLEATGQQARRLLAEVRHEGRLGGLAQRAQALGELLGRSVGGTAARVRRRHLLAV
jgi:hypothetical protein